MSTREERMSQRGYMQGMTSVTVPLNKTGPLKKWERPWQPGDVAVIRFRGVQDFVPAAGWMVKHEAPYAYVWRVLQHQDADHHVFHLAQVGDHVEWDLLILGCELFESTDELDTTVTAVPR